MSITIEKSKGISYNSSRGMWVVRPTFNKEVVYLGSFIALEEAEECLRAYLSDNKVFVKTYYPAPVLRLEKAFNWFRNHAFDKKGIDAALDYVKNGHIYDNSDGEVITTPNERKPKKLTERERIQLKFPVYNCDNCGPTKLTVALTCDNINLCTRCTENG
jgi:hypothetical protein